MVQGIADGFSCKLTPHGLAIGIAPEHLQSCVLNDEVENGTNISGNLVGGVWAFSL